MKWFKHLVGSGHDPDIGLLETELGFKGYYLFFRTLEIMSREFDVENPGKNRFAFQWFLSQFSRKIDKKTILKFLEITKKTHRIYYKMNGKKLYLNCPKLKKLCDKYTEDTLREKEKLIISEIEPTSQESSKHRLKIIDNKNLSKDKCTEIDFTLTNLLINGILKNDSKAKVPEKGTEQYLKWANQARLMREADNRSPQEIEMLIRFAHEDEFWQSNILSMGKLRDKATQLFLKAKRFKPDDIGSTPKKLKTPQQEERLSLIEKKRSDLIEKHKPDLDNADTLEKKEAIQALINTQVATYSRQLEGEG
ncbi:MAG TPA: hypothetical protein VMW10_06895 [Alphaproteobacteria bacterium]|nr:hypothetical protein [Alphaproteobacteria bacterium]